MIRENLVKALAGLLMIVVLMSVLSFWFEKEMGIMTNWIVDHIGFVGLCLIMLMTDTLITPFLPDILLVVIAKSELAKSWLHYVLILSSVSVIAGMLGWAIGRWLSQFHFIQHHYRKISQEQREFIEAYGFWAIALGATTPLPYSVTCWTAGALGVRWTKVLVASILFRIPRFFIYYLLIASTGYFVNESWHGAMFFDNFLEYLSLLIIFPVGALLIGGIFLIVAIVRGKVLPYITATLWLIYGIYESLMYTQVLCSGECNIRVDLLVIYPLLIVATVVGIISAIRQKI